VPPRGLPPMSCRIRAISQTQLSNRYVRAGIRRANTTKGCDVRTGRAGGKTLSNAGSSAKPANDAITCTTASNSEVGRRRG
jgi:hypothetical protein